MKLDRKQDLKLIYKGVFRSDRKNKMAIPASDLLRHFRLLWIHWTEFDGTWQEARSKRPLQSLCFLGPIGKTRSPPPRSLIGWDIFHFSSETAEWNSTKLVRKQDLDVLYKFVFFGPISKKEITAQADPSKRLYIVLRCTICGPLGLLLGLAYVIIVETSSLELAVIFSTFHQSDHLVFFYQPEKHKLGRGC